MLKLVDAREELYNYKTTATLNYFKRKQHKGSERGKKNKIKANLILQKIAWRIIFLNVIKLYKIAIIYLYFFWFKIKKRKIYIKKD